MTTEKLYDLDSYCKQFTATVLSCEKDPKNEQNYLVVLDRTAFFPEGGGQPSDIGSLGDSAVTYVCEEEGVIYHHCDRPLKAGEKVSGEISWEFRFSNMQIHSGEHILSAMILKEYGIRNIGFHMGKECTTIDLEGSFSAEMVENIEHIVDRVIGENVPVRVSYPSKEEIETIPLRKKPDVESLRVVEVCGYDWCGCCGTHVSRTGEIQLLKIIDFQRYKGGTRMFFLCGKAAFADYQAKHASLKALAEEFSCKPQGVSDAVHRIEQELSDTKALLAEKNKALFSLMGEKMLADAPEKDGCKWLFLFGGFSPEEAKTFATTLTKESDCFCTFFMPSPSGIRFVLAKSKNNTSIAGKALCQAMNKQFGGKGGGNEELACGNIPQAQKEELYRFFAQELGL